MLFQSQAITIELSLSLSSSVVSRDFASEKEGFSEVINFYFHLAVRYTITHCAHKRWFFLFNLEVVIWIPIGSRPSLYSAINAQYIEYQIA